MATHTTTKKRKSVDGATTTAKKAKIFKSADRPSPLKSALKQTKTAKPAETKITNGASSKERTKPRKDVPAVVEENDGNNDTSKTLTPTQTAALLAGFSSSDSSDNEEEAGVPLTSIPSIPHPKPTKQFTTAPDPESTPATLYLGRLPHGFHEPQLLAYFSQFGTLLNLKLCRNPKTGRPRHYGFIEFASSAVADIVAKTMDKYLLFGHILQVRKVDSQDGVWGGRRKRNGKVAPRNRIEGSRLRRGADRGVWTQRVERERERRERKGRLLGEIGYQFEIPGVKGIDEVPLKKGKGGVEEVGAEGGIEGGVKLLQNGEDTVTAQNDDVVPAEVDVVQETPEAKVASKKRPAHGKTQVKKAVKKVKT